MKKLFGTDGVRGIANMDLTAELAYKLGAAGVCALGASRKKPVILIGRDTRISGDMLEDALSAGILSMGGNVIKTGVLPTPAVAYLVRRLNTDAGVVISASHNPFEYNGIKFFNGEGFKLDDSIENEIERVILDGSGTDGCIVGEDMGRSLKSAEDASRIYVDFLKAAAGVRLDGMKLVIDCANGAAYQTAEKVFQELGAKTVMLGNSPDGVNINDGCGSTHPEELQRAVLRENADLGLAFDGDADRLIAADEKGRLIDGDKILYICGRMLKEQGKLADNLITATVMSNIGLTIALEGIGCRLERTEVGDRYVLERMLRTGGVIGGEQSGHIIFLNHSTTGDGVLAALMLIKAVLSDGGRPSELADRVTIYPQVLCNARVKNENRTVYMQNPVINEAIGAMEGKMAGGGRVLIRPSGTEPMVRVMLEGDDLKKLTALAEELAELITKKLG
ncbi:MAG: phosphoglucosamine mutase [Clostridiales Family XIII bacterium]|jgi:phosphoglucosamine mutase|nr:phosphoglucosamine mutase [Clostridiales Family XIII bacterium]